MSATAANELGMLALIDDAKRASALAEVRSGRMYDLGHVLDESVPVFPGRYFKQTLVTTAHHANADGGVGENRVNWITELVSGTMQLGHPSRRALAPADGRPRLRRIQRLGARRHGRGHQARRRDRAADRHEWLAGRCGEDWSRVT